MHELSIASSLVESVLGFVETHKPGKVLVVRMSVGELTCIEPEQLQFCYTAVTRDTPLEESTLEIDRVQAEVSCPHCSYSGRAKYWEDALAATTLATLQCPVCGRTASAMSGHECAIKTIRYVA